LKESQQKKIPKMEINLKIKIRNLQQIKITKEKVMDNPQI